MKVEFTEPMEAVLGKITEEEFAERTIPTTFDDRPDPLPFTHNGHLPSRFKSWDELDAYLADIRDQGYIVRTIVARWNAVNNEVMQTWNWGVIIAFNRYQLNGEIGPYKPIVVQWVSNGKTSAELPEDLFVIYPCPGFNVLVETLNEQRKGRSIK